MITIKKEDERKAPWKPSLLMELLHVSMFLKSFYNENDLNAGIVHYVLVKMINL